MSVYHELAGLLELDLASNEKPFDDKISKGS